MCSAALAPAPSDPSPVLLKWPERYRPCGGGASRRRDRVVRARGRRIRAHAELDTGTDAVAEQRRGWSTRLRWPSTSRGYERRVIWLWARVAVLLWVLVEPGRLTRFALPCRARGGGRPFRRAAPRRCSVGGALASSAPTPQHLPGLTFDHCRCGFVTRLGQRGCMRDL
jgi:hypothetical protein